MKKFKNSRLSTDSRKLQTLALKIWDFIRGFYCNSVELYIDCESQITQTVSKS